MVRARYHEGFAIRREMLGAEYVDRTIDGAGSLDPPFQDLVNEFSDGGVWARPGTPRPMRSPITLALLSALNRPEELRLHVRAALSNRASREEFYCGMAAGRKAFAAAMSVLAAVDAE